MFDRNHGRAPAAPRNTLNMVQTENVNAVETEEQLAAWVQERIAEHEYCSYGQAAVILGFTTLDENGKTKGFRNSDVTAVTTYFAEAVNGGDAIVVNGRGGHDAKVAAQHRTALEGLGYTEFPVVTSKGRVVENPND